MVTTADPVRILIADDHPVLREGLRSILRLQPEFAVIGEASDGAEALLRIQELKPDVVLLDYSMPNLTGLQVLQQMRARAMPARVIILTAAIERSEIVTLLQYGARGIVLKTASTDLLVRSIRHVHGGDVWIARESIPDVVAALSSYRDIPPPRPAVDFGLTPREFEIVRLIVEGETNKRISKELSIGQDTVKHHLTSIFNKTGASNRLELALFALHHRLVTSEPVSFDQ